MKDPAFLFYPGDYLRDTQTLSEKSQVAYDRIMCEHMRNICITKQQLNFFTKRLNESEIEEIMFVLKEIEGGYCIEWVAESIEKRRQYSDSRKKNREGKNKKDMLTYDVHMENENEIENVSKKESKKEKEYSFIDNDFKIIFTEWLDYKKSRKESYKSEKSIEVCYNKLIKLSNNNPNIARSIIEQSMANNWSGFFELKSKDLKQFSIPLSKKSTYDLFNGTN